MAKSQSLVGRLLRRFATPNSSIVPSGVTIRNKTRELGGTGTQNYHGYITEDFNPKFIGDSAISIYDEMRKTDGTVAGVIRALKLPIMSAEYTIESADSSDDKQNEIAEFVRKNLFEGLEGGFRQFLHEALNYFVFGFYYFEKVYKVEDGMVKLRKLAPRLPSAHYRWVMDSNPNVPGVTQLLPSITNGSPTNNTKPEIPMDKLVLFTNEKEGDNYEGTSILRSAYKHFYLKDSLYRIDGIKHERGAGILKIKLPAGSSNEDQDKAEELGENFKINEQAFIVLPNNEWDAELMTSGISDQSAALMESVKHHDRMITTNILAQFLDLGSSSGGSYSLSKDQSSFFGLAVQSIGEYVSEVINEQIIKELVRMNYGEQEAYPRFNFPAIGEVDYTEMATVIEKLLTAGVVKNDAQLKVFVHKMFGLPDVSLEDFEDEEDAELNDLLADLAVLESELAGLPSDGSEMPQEEMTDEEMMNKAKELPEEQKAELTEAFEFVAKGQPLSAETKKKISEALKKGGTADPESLQGKYDRDDEISSRSFNIADAKRRIQELRDTIKAFQETSKGIKNRSAKRAFNASIKAKVAEMRTMIAVGVAGIKAERGKIKERKDEIRDEHHQEKAIEREQKMRDRLQNKQDKINERIQAAKDSLMNAKTPEARDRIRARIDEMMEEHDEIDQQLRSAQPLSLAERGYFRQLTLAENRVKFADVENFFDNIEKGLSDYLDELTATQKKQLMAEIKRILDSEDIGAVADLAIPGNAELLEELKKRAKEALEEGKKTAALEVGGTIPVTSNFTKKVLEAKVALAIKIRTSALEDTIKARLVDLMNNDVGKAAAMFELEQIIDDTAEKANDLLVGKIGIDFFDEGRALTFEDMTDQLHALQRSEILDDVTCAMCMSLDGRVLAATDPFTKIGQIHTHCRGIWVGVLKTDAELPNITPLPKSIKNKFETIEGVPSINNFKQIKVPVVRKGSRLDRKIKDGDIEI